MVAFAISVVLKGLILNYTYILVLKGLNLNSQVVSARAVAWTEGGGAWRGCRDTGLCVCPQQWLHWGKQDF